MENRAVPGAIFSPKLLIYLAPRAGFEPATNRLTVVSNAIPCDAVQLLAQAKPLHDSDNLCFPGAGHCALLHPSARTGT
jgi:hypothetical protein